MKTKEQVKLQIAKIQFNLKQTRDDIDSFTDIRADKARQNLTKAMLLVEDAEKFFAQIDFNN